MSQSESKNSVELIHTTIEAWWKGLQQNYPDKKQNLPTKYRAQLKRCHEPVAALMTEGFQELWRKLPNDFKKDYHLLPWASAACFLAHIQHDAGFIKSEKDKSKPFPFARSLGTKNPKTETPALSKLRFAQLQNSRSEKEFFVRMIRAIKLIDNKCSIQSVWQETLCWYREHAGFFPKNNYERQAVRWAMEYYSQL